MTNSKLQELEALTESLLAQEAQLTHEKIRDTISRLRVVTQSVTDEEAERLARRLEERHTITLQLGSALSTHEFRPWLDSERIRISPYYWQRYRKLLQTKHWPKDVISTLNDETERILGFLENPERDGAWQRRGMVVGEVQSGKTANYTGLICKAADAGYRLIVVIAGIHNNLRNQTQRRIDEGFVGRDSARLLTQREDRFIGVGKFGSERRPATFTNSAKDFSKEKATSLGIPIQNLKEPAVFVIKKNPNTLANLIEWLKEHSAAHGHQRIDQPMLLIDDEADNASINVAYGKDTISRINGQIRELLQLFSRASYVGYTATPFANIFIDPNTADEMRGHDLFPRDFIVSLEAPTNYFGAIRVFQNDPDILVRHVDDADSFLPIEHKIDHRVTELPRSMDDAIRCFVVARAIRILRGQGQQHSSMLINASRFTNIHTQLRLLVQQHLERIQASVRINAALPDEKALLDDEIASLNKVLAGVYSSLSIPWKDVKRVLLDAASPIRVVEVNTRSHGALAYDEYEGTGLNVIAIGGYSLSRGLTLEGLVVSYYLRNSRMYDTLMQMGRWFGYRDGYDDLCRIWMPEDAEGWYAHITDAAAELREEFRQMAAANATPIEFGLKVRAHPTALEVTARNKMGSAESVTVRIGLKNRFIETTIIRRDVIERNVASARRFIDQLLLVVGADGPIEVGGTKLFRDVSVNHIKTFLAEFVNHQKAILTDPTMILRYINENAETNLKSWDVAIVGLQPTGRLSKGNYLEADVLGFEIWCQERKAGRRSNAQDIFISEKQRVASRGAEQIGVDTELVRKAEEEFRERNPRNRKGGWNYPDRIYRAVRSTPLLLIHPLVIDTDGIPDCAAISKPAIAWSISFPDSTREEHPIEYVVTTTWLRENLAIVEEESDDESGDD